MTTTAYDKEMLKAWLKVAFERIVDVQSFFSVESEEHQQLEQAGDLVLRVWHKIDTTTAAPGTRPS